MLDPLLGHLVRQDAGEIRQPIEQASRLDRCAPGDRPDEIDAGGVQAGRHPVPERLQLGPGPCACPARPALWGQSLVQELNEIFHRLTYGNTESIRSSIARFMSGSSVTEADSVILQASLGAIPLRMSRPA